MLRNARGERPFDVARRRGHSHLLTVLDPVVVHDVSLNALNEIEPHFHALIRHRANPMIEKHELRLPDLEILRELPSPAMWLPIPEMYGGFRFTLEQFHDCDVLVATSWSSARKGSGQEHLISRFGWLLIDSEVA